MDARAPRLWVCSAELPCTFRGLTSMLEPQERLPAAAEDSRNAELLPTKVCFGPRTAELSGRDHRLDPSTYRSLPQSLDVDFLPISSSHGLSDHLLLRNMEHETLDLDQGLEVLLFTVKPITDMILNSSSSKSFLVPFYLFPNQPATGLLDEGLGRDRKVLEKTFMAKQPQVPQPLLIRLLLQTLHQLRCPSLDTLQHLNVSLVVGGPKLNRVFEVQPHQAAFQPLFPKPAALHGVAVTQVQDLALGLLEPHTIDLGPSIQPVQVPLQSLPTLKQINTPTQLGVICKLTDGAINPFVQIIDKDIKQNWPPTEPWGTPLVTGRQLE
ncbi:hypothetical protein QYF61_003302 [Mycteria americana]|uniref:Uncharacterized protein n=1 Tax=Mycteria americana TaxID=33587 RepID=A0AAN7N8L5_MYCAM|nr:hypothetical protein QYF61_003302 [Mycteria americana]